MRKSVYLREKLDDDILKVIEPLLKNQSFAHIMRELARDGIKYRNGEGGGVAAVSIPVSHKVIQSTIPEQPLPTAPLKEVKLIKKEASNQDIADRLDNF